MSQPKPEDGDPLSDRGQAQRAVSLLRLAGPCAPQAQPSIRRGSEAIAPYLLVTRQAARLRLNPTYLPL